MGDAAVALDAARQSYRIAASRENERDRIRAESLLGAAQVALAAEDQGKRKAHLTDAEGHLTEALARCRAVSLVELEPDILLAWAKWHRLSGNADEARAKADEALTIADRCEYRLKQADIHNFLARLALDAGDRDDARAHAERARERAECDGEPHWHRPAYDEAERLLGEIG